MKRVTDLMAEKLVSKFCEILDQHGDKLKVDGPSIGRSFSWPDEFAPDEEFEVSVSVRRVDRERRMSSGEAREVREIASRV